MTRSGTRQEQVWRSPFGDRYVGRNDDPGLLAGNTALFASILRRTSGVQTVLELGANIGLNLRALHHLIPAIRCDAVEINAKAVARLRELPFVTVHPGSALTFQPKRTWDLVLSKGFLIHVAPESLARVYEVLHASTGRYVCLAEYYSPDPVEVPYRGRRGILFKRDFAGELLDRYPDFDLLDYGFFYHRDPYFPQGDIVWFLLEKKR